MSEKKSIGGQAVIEGVMMRAPNKLVIAVRKPDGNIIVKKDDIKIDSNKFFKKPIIRGLIGLYDALVLGVKALNFSAEHGMPDEFEKEQEANDKKGNFRKKAESFLSIALGLGLGILLFVYLPLLLTDLLKAVVPAIEQSFLLYNLVDGIIRVIFFVLYIVAISQFKDIQRVFSYHGAEHKAIYTYEQGLDLTVENARNMTRLHPRCGTSFLLIVMIIATFVFTMIPEDSHFVIKFGSRIVLMPLIAGISYEVLKLSGKYHENAIVKTLIAPGLWLQRLTTREPDDKMIEVALISIKEALKADDEPNDPNIEYAN